MAKRPKNLTLQDTVANHSDRNRRSSSSDRGLIKGFSWAARIFLLIAIISAPWMIASVTSAAQLFISVLLLLAIGCWWIETSLGSKKKQHLPYIALFVFLGMAIGFLQTLPLSEGFIGLMTGRQQEFNEVFFQGDPRAAEVPIRLSLDTEGTWHQLRLLVIAFVCLLLSCRYFRSEKHLKLFYSAVLINGVVLTAFGLLQNARFNGKLLWYIELPDNTSPFASFVCPNNAAGYLVMCLAAGVGLFMLLISGQSEGKPRLIVSKEIPFWRQINTYLSMFAEKLDVTKIMIMVACGFISVGVFASFSRGGVLALLGGCVFAAIIYNATRRPKFAGLLLIPIGAITLLTAFFAGYGDRIWSKFENIDSLEIAQTDARIGTWRDTLPAGFENGWFGTGLGSYRSVHRIYRSNPESSIFEYAENQYVQTIVESGIPGIVLLVSAILVGFWYLLLLLIRGGSGTSVGTGVFAALLICGQLLAAIFDFGWYIPANMVLFAAGMGVVAQQAHGLADRLKKRSLLRFGCPNWFCQILILGSFLLTMFVAYNLFQTTMLISEFDKNYRNNTYQAFVSSSFGEVNDKIDSLTPRVANAPSTRGLNYLGDLHLMRARMQYLELLKEGTDSYENLTGEVRDQMDQSLWNLTSTLRLHQKIVSLENQNEFRILNRLKSQYFFKIDLNQALLYYQASRRISPLQPETQLLIGQLTTVLKDNEIAQIEIAKTLKLSPQNGDYRLRSAISQLQSGEVESGIENLKYLLTLNRKKYFRTVMNLVTGNTDRQLPAINNQLIVDKIIGEDPNLLYTFSTTYVQPADPFRMEALKRADELLVGIPLDDSKALQLKANVNRSLGNTEIEIEYLEKLVRSDPANQQLRYRLASTLYEYGYYKEAEKEILRLYRINEKSKIYINLFDKVKAKLKLKNSAGANLRAKRLSLDFFYTGTIS